MKPGSFREPQPEPEAAGGVPQGVRVLAFLCGLVVIWLGGLSARDDWARVDKLTHLDRMASAPGRLLKVEVRRDSAGAEKDWYPDVLYEYFIDGKSVWGWRLSYEEEPNSKAYWQERLKGYTVGGPATVYYDPARPKDSILEKKHDGLYRVWMKMALGGGFLLAGLLMAGLSLAGWFRR